MFRDKIYLRLQGGSVGPPAYGPGYDFMVFQLSPTAEPKDYIYSVACMV